MKPDEALMEELEALEQLERSMALGGYEATEDFENVQKSQLQIYNELKRRGWKWSDREKDWVKDDKR
jgi:hypothetical protein